MPVPHRKQAKSETTEVSVSLRLASPGWAGCRSRRPLSCASRLSAQNSSHGPRDSFRDEGE
ncbi:hypothetical protein AAT19DRAFT_9532 [Rhodotorula toruloides]|uniref:Uncharacterized protein n=1 Tax=Rhodotorula toruloides TaxID=5286 RepID=A0A2T0A2I1_RHOTO|nr:hypothetical protein AAT19DRAFT_9532 [Rhodotorula toruloides]